MRRARIKIVKARWWYDDDDDDANRLMNLGVVLRKLK